MTYFLSKCSTINSPVNHSILCDKLKYYGFRGKSNELIKSFLSNRSQYVSINGYDSNKLDVNLDTWTFVIPYIYINDLRYSLKFCSTSQFADDTCIIYANKKPKTLETNINHDLKG